MGLASGALSLSRFEIHFEKRKPQLSWAHLSRLLEPWKAPALSLERKLAPESTGWVFPSGHASLLDGENLTPGRAWDLEMCSVHETIFLRMRVEKRHVPPQLLQELYKNELLHYEAKYGHQPKAAEKRQLKIDLQANLTKRALPTIQHVDGLWFLGDNTFWVLTSGKRLKGLFVELFSQTFLKPLKGVALDITAPTLALKNLETESKEPGDLDVASEAMKLLSSAVPVSLAQL